MGEHTYRVFSGGDGAYPDLVQPIWRSHSLEKQVRLGYDRLSFLIRLYLARIRGRFS